MKDTTNEHINKLNNSFINELESIYEKTSDPETKKILEIEINDAKSRLKNISTKNINHTHQSNINNSEDVFKEARNEYQQKLESLNKIKKYTDNAPLIKLKFYIIILFGLIIYGLYKYA